MTRQMELGEVDVVARCVCCKRLMPGIAPARPGHLKYCYACWHNGGPCA